MARGASGGTGTIVPWDPRGCAGGPGGWRIEAERRLLAFRCLVAVRADGRRVRVGSWGPWWARASDLMRDYLDRTSPA